MSKEKKWSNKIRKRLLSKLSREEDDINNSSDSRVIVRYLLNGIFNIISWIIIAFFVYIWWNAIGSPIGCEQISPDLCNNCFARGIIG